MMPSEYKAYYKNIAHKYGSKHDFETAITHDRPYEENSDEQKLLATYNVYKLPEPDNTWHEAVVTDPIFSIRSWGGLKKYMKKL